MESPWAFTKTERFDFIHGRTLGGSVRDWTKLYQQAYRYLKPGVRALLLSYSVCLKLLNRQQGWIELQEWGMGIHSDEDLDLVKTPSLKQWCDLLNEDSLHFEILSLYLRTAFLENIAGKIRQWETINSE